MAAAKQTAAEKESGQIPYIAWRTILWDQLHYLFGEEFPSVFETFRTNLGPTQPLMFCKNRSYKANKKRIETLRKNVREKLDDDKEQTLENIGKALNTVHDPERDLEAAARSELERWFELFIYIRSMVQKQLADNVSGVSYTPEELQVQEELLKQLDADQKNEKSIKRRRRERGPNCQGRLYESSENDSCDSENDSDDDEDMPDVDNDPYGQLFGAAAAFKSQYRQFIQKS